MYVRLIFEMIELISPRRSNNSEIETENNENIRTRTFYFRLEYTAPRQAAGQDGGGAQCEIGVGPEHYSEHCLH